MRSWPVVAAALAVAALPPRAVAQTAPHLPPLPDSSGWGVPILALGRGNDGSLWVGTYGQGIYVLRRGATAWEHLAADTAAGRISFDFVHAFAFAPHGDIWYGTVGNGWGLSRDGGRTWRNWQYRDLGPQWQYVAPNGIVTRGDTVFVATADGLQWSSDHGAVWHQAADSGDGVRGGLPSPYLLAVGAARDWGLWVSTIHGVDQWRPLGSGRVRTQDTIPPPVPVLGPRVRAMYVVQGEKALVPLILGGELCPGSLRPKIRQQKAYWLCVAALMRGAPAIGRAVRQIAGCGVVMCAGATSSGAFESGPLAIQVLAPPTARASDVYAVLPPVAGQPGDTLFGTACGFLGAQPEACLARGDSAGVRAPAAPLHTIFGRPIAPTDQPFIDQTYRYGSTMGGTFQQHQGVEFNDPVGTPVHAVGAGVVVYAGPAERGALTVAIRHDEGLAVNGHRNWVFSTYYHNSRLLVAVGQRVTRGQVISLVGNTGRATNPHVHLEVHVAPSEDVRQVVDSLQRFPPYTTNPELWIEPLPGTGVVAGIVRDEAGRPVPQARIYGLVKPEPQETPFLYAETYGDKAHSDPAYHEDFAVGDVPAGEYDLGVEIAGKKVFRHVRVEAGKYTWVEFKP